MSASAFGGGASPGFGGVSSVGTPAAQSAALPGMCGQPATDGDFGQPAAGGMFGQSAAVAVAPGTTPLQWKVEMQAGLESVNQGQAQQVEALKRQLQQVNVP